MGKMTAIITPTWNNEDYTIRCFDSIGKNTKDYKIIWIDNGSTEESRNRVKKFLDENDILYELIQNEENLGFVKATNQGMKRAMELGVEYVVLQNNDTEVYEGWLERYKEVAESDPKIGIVGPITSPCTSWQSIENLKNSIPEFSDLPEYNNSPEEYAEIIKKKYDGEIFESKIQMAFFSTLIKKEVIEDIGFLSEEFGVGFGDDDDYCIRAMKKKWKLFLAKDVFVFHNHRTTFKKIYSDKIISQMLDKNGEACRRKHKYFLGEDVKKIDICFFSHSAHLGGSERSLLELVKDLKSKEILCRIFLPENGPLEDELKKIAVSYEVVDYRWWTLQENENERDVARLINEQAMSLIERVAKLNPDLIYTNTSVVNVGAIIAKELGIPHVWHVREYGEKDHGLKFVLDEKKRAEYISNNSDFVFFNSGAVSDYYSKLADFKSNAIVYNSVSVDNFSQDLERGEVFKKDNFFHVSIIGTVSPGKGQKDAVMALKKLISKGRKIELAIIGNVSDITYLSEIEEIINKEGLEDNIYIYNFIRNVFPVIKKSDLILVCSKNEAFGRITVEGMLAKKPVIGTNSGGTPEIIKDGVNGFLYEPGYYDQLAEKIEWVIKNPKEAKEMGENGYKIVSDKFSKNNYSGKILGFLKEIISNNLTRDIFREEGSNLVLNLLKEIKSKDQEMDIKNGENACLKEENEKIKEENEGIKEEILIIKNSKFWKLRNFYLKVKHYFIFIFLNPRKFVKKQFKKIKNIFCYYKQNGFISTCAMISRKILPAFVYVFFHRLYSRFYLVREFSNKNKVIFVFPVINWNSRWQRPQQILSRFAKEGYRIIYLQMAIIDSSKIAKNKKEGFDMLSIGRIYKNVYELTLSGRKPFDVHSNKISPDNLKNFTIQISSLMESYKIKNPYYMVHFPNWSDLVFSLNGKIKGTIVFDCMDDHSGFSTASKDIVETEKKLINKSDLVISSSALLHKRNSKGRENNILVKNGTEYDHFNKVYRNGKLNNIKKPIIGYYGAINDWFDMGIIKYCAESRLNWSFVLIGGTDNKNFEKDKLILKGLKNVFFLGEKKYSDLPGYVGYFDVCIIPFKLIPLIMATNPVKFYEYISSGKPVVSVKLPELLPYKDICYLAEDKEGFLGKIEEALDEDNSELRIKRMKVAKENSWDTRYKSIRNELIKFNKKN